MEASHYRYLGILLLILLAGCAGASFTRYPDDALVLGRTSSAEIRSRLGEPFVSAIIGKTYDGKTIEQISYAYRLGGAGLHESEDFFFVDDKLVAYQFDSSFNGGNTNFDDTKIEEIKKDVSTRSDVERLLGAPSGRYIYPFVKNPDENAIGYVYTDVEKWGPNKYHKELKVTFNKQGIVTTVAYKESGEK
jgi:hypothetical protein